MKNQCYRDRLVRAIVHALNVRGVVLLVIHDNCTVTCDGYGCEDTDLRNIARLATRVRTEGLQ